MLLLVAAATACSAPPEPPPSTQPSPPPKPAPPAIGVLAAAAIGTDKGPCCHNYTELYERLLFERKDDPIKIFEIGIAGGGSLKMWHAYFPKARIFAVDILPKSEFDTERVKTLIADQANRDQLQAALDVSGDDIDVLIDDGGHTMEQQQVSLGFLFKSVKPGGYYVIEDVHTSLPALWKGYGVERGERNTTLRMLENFVRSTQSTITSKYMLPDEIAHFECPDRVREHFVRPNTRSIAAILKKKS